MKGSVIDTYTYDAKYQAILDEADFEEFKKPTIKTRRLQNAMCIALQDAEIWDILDELYICLGTGSVDFKSMNWINPFDKFSYTDGLVNSDDYKLITNQNSTGSGAVAWGNAISPYMYGDDIKRINRKVNSASFGYHTDGFTFGGTKSVSTPSYYIYPRELEGSMRLYFHNESFLNLNPSPIGYDVNGLRSFTRNDNSVSTYLNGDLKHSNTQGYTALKNEEIRFFYRTNERIRYSLAYMGGYLDEAKIIALNDIFQTYKNAFEAI